MSEQTTVAPCCVSGHLHAGTPKGKETVIDGIDVYETGDVKNKGKALVFIHDIFGWKFPNARLLADVYAENGFYVYLPDLFEKDTTGLDVVMAVPSQKERDNGMGSFEHAWVNINAAGKWEPFITAHSEAATKPIISKFLAALRADSASKKIGTVGFCWGGRYALLFANEGGFDANFAAHPSFLSIPSDLDNIVKPVEVAIGDQDALLPMPEVAKVQKIFASYKQPAVVKIYPGRDHGFTVRGDLYNDLERDAKEEAVAQVVSFFNKYL